jgi:SH3 domain protein
MIASPRAIAEGVSMYKWLALLMVALVPAVSIAETKYISDELTVPLRRGPNTSFKVIHAGLPSGTALEVMAPDDGSGYTHVRMQNGTDGWVPTQYLSATPSARDQLAAATKRIESLSAELNNLRQGVKEEKSARSSAEGTSSELNKQIKQLQTELAEIRRVSANAVATYEENKLLKEQSDKLQKSLNEQIAETTALKSHELEIWLLTGAGLVVLGLLFGVIIKSRPKSRNGW